MNPTQLLKTALTALGANKTRTSLTMLGIIIGIMSVIVMLGIGTGAQQTITSSLTSLGTNILSITAGAQQAGIVQQGVGTATTLTLQDAEAIESHVTNLNAVSPEVQSQAQLLAGDANTNSPVYGVNQNYATVHNYQIQEGSFITQNNVTSTARVAVIGPDIASTLFGTIDPVGQSMKIGKVKFTIIGETVSKGTVGGFLNEDNVVFIPLSTAQHIVLGTTNLRTISVQVNSADNVTQAQNDITNLLLARHHISDPTLADFTIRNSASTLQTLTSTTQVFTILLASIASISLLVGGIGIMNIMIVTVTERTREIGLRKAIGAKNKTILAQFLIEAIVLTVISGILGVGLGFLIARIMMNFITLTIAITPPSILLAVGVSLLVGIIFGLYPAYKASRLSPIEALRYE